MSWIEHVKAWQSSHPGCTYKQAMTDAKASYVKNVKSSVPKTPRSKVVTSQEAKDFIKKHNLNYASVLKDSKKY